jgi:hypothetical protein
MTIQNVSNYLSRPRGYIPEFMDPLPQVPLKDGFETLSAARRLPIWFDTESWCQDFLGPDNSITLILCYINLQFLPRRKNTASPQQKPTD